MAININWNKVKVYLPSWDGPMTCPACQGPAYSIGGPDRSGKMAYTSWCFDCSWKESENWTTRDIGEDNE